MCPPAASQGSPGRNLWYHDRDTGPTDARPPGDTCWRSRPSTAEALMGIFSKSKAERYNAEAERCIQRGEWDRAFALFWQAIQVAPHEAAYRYNLGLCIMQAAQTGTATGGTLGDAIEAFRTALALKLDWAEAWLALGKALGQVVTTPTQGVTQDTRWLAYTAGFAATFLAAILDEGSVSRLAIMHLQEFRSYEGVHFQKPAMKVPFVYAFAFACTRCCADAGPHKLCERSGDFLEDYSSASRLWLELVQASYEGAPDPRLRQAFMDLAGRDDFTRLFNALLAGVPDFLKQLLR